jgi:hypothetical protein
VVLLEQKGLQAVGSSRLTQATDLPLSTTVQAAPHPPAVFVVRLVAYKKDDDIVAKVCAHFLDPFCRVQEGILVCTHQLHFTPTV